MPSALKILHPHLMIKGEKTKLGSSFHVDQKVSANSQSPCDIQERTRRFTMYSKSQSILHEQFGKSETSGPRMNRWKSEPRMSTIGDSSAMPLSRSQEMELMLTNRESMRALSEFLRTKEPPPGNFMSIPDPGNSDRNRMKRSALKLFGKHTRRKPATPPKLLRLPDSAISAKTTDGHRHIAISIPIEYDYPYHQEVRSPLQQHPIEQPKQPKERSESGPVIVIKPTNALPPVCEAHEQKSPRLYQCINGRTSPSVPATAPVAQHLDSESVKMLERYDSQIRRSDLDNKHKRKNSQLSLDPRHSGGTAYSTASISTPQAHSREISSASNTSSIPRALGLPVRNSSISSKIARSSQVVVPQTLDTIINLGRDVQPRSSLMSENSGNVSPIFYGTAEFARGYTSQLPSPTPAPTRNLPEVPNRSLKEEVESHCLPYFVSQPSSPSPLGIQEINSRVAKHQTNSNPPVPSQRGRDDVIGSARQARKERVKAKKERDIAALRETKSKRVALSDISREPSLNIRPSTAPSLPVGRRKLSTEKSQHQNKNSLTDIMVVAELAPFTGNVYISDWVLRPPKKPTKLQKHDSLPTSNNSRPQESHTPRSMKFAGGSDSETLPRMIARERKSTPPLRSSKSKLDMRREQRRTKRNSLLREREVDARLSKIEKDNAILLHAMSGMAKNFSGLSRILVQERMEEQDEEEQPVMRQSQGPARRTGIERGRTNGSVY